MGESLAQARHRYATVDRDKQLERMLTEIGLGIPKAEAASVTSPADAALWDRMAAQVRAAPAGRITSYDLEGG